MLMLANGSTSSDIQQVRVELHNDELIIRKDVSGLKRNASRPGAQQHNEQQKNVS